MKIGVVLCTLGERSSLKHTFQSIEKIQDQIELIVICPKDTYRNVLQKSQNFINPSNVEVFIQKNPGIYACMNQGANLVKSKYVAFINDDDVLDNDIKKNLGILISEVKKHDVLLASSGIVGRKDYVEHPSDDYLNNILIGRMSASHQAQIWSLDTFKECGLFQESISLRIGLIKIEIDLQIASDFNTYVSAFLRGKKIGRTEIIFSSYSIGGISDQRFNRRILETVVILYQKRLISIGRLFILLIRFQLSYVLRLFRYD